jgi:two-component sensor histidine kinase
MNRLGDFDLPDRLAPMLPPWATQILFAFFCLGVAGATRLAIDTVFPGAGPFALVYPAAIAATLFARWPSGFIVLAVSLTYAWYFVLPPQGSFTLSNPGDGPRTVVVAAGAVLSVVIAELFRRAVRRAGARLDSRVEERDLLLRELDHRVKNSFALVAGLLDLQRRRSDNAATREALDAALSRVQSIAQAHRHLYRDAAVADKADMKVYLGDLCHALSDALFLSGAIRLTCTAEPALLPRDRAVSIGLVVNELVTNAAKHAFNGRPEGSISVTFARREGGWRLGVADDGIGLPETIREGALGRRLIDSFATQAGGTLSHTTGPTGTVFTLDLAP